MNNIRKKMQQGWEINSKTYTNPIGMTGRRPDEIEFHAVIEDICRKFDITVSGLHSILDVGCNNGHLLNSLKPSVTIKIGMDFCMAPIVAGRLLFPDIIFLRGEITAIPFRDDEFDRVLCYNMYHYLPSVEIGLEAACELYRILKPGGQMLIGDIFTAEHRNLIPQADLEKWDSSERPFLHRLSNWLFMPIQALSNRLMKMGAATEISSQEGPLRCPGYRFDLIVWKPMRLQS